MASVGDWIYENCSTIGQGPLVLTGSLVGFSRFRDQFTSSTQVWYSVEEGGNREVGIGTFDGFSTIQRTQIMATLKGGVFTSVNPTPLSLQGDSLVACTFNAKAFKDLADHVASTSNPHNVLPSQITYDPTDDPVTTQTDLASALIDHATSIEERVASKTGVIEGGLITGMGTNIDISAGKGIIVDSYTDPEDTSIVNLSWTQKLAVAVDFGGKNTGATRVAITSAGNVLQITGPVQPEEFRDNIFLGIVYFVNGAITEILNTPSIIKQTASDTYDLLRANLSTNGITINPVTAALSVWISGGTVFYPGINWGVNRKNPNVASVPQIGDASTPVSFYLMTQDNNITGPVSVIPKQYNPSGSTLTNLTSNNATIHRLYTMGIVNGTRIFIIVVGQNLYSTATTAKSNLLTDADNTNFPSEIADAFLIGYIGVSSAAVNFASSTEAWIVSQNIGSGGGSSSGVATDHTTLLNKGAADQHPIEAIGTPGGEQLRDTLDGKAKWVGQWEYGEYLANDIVWDDGWTAIANTTTRERPSPQPFGAPTYLYSDNLSNTSFNGKQVVFGTDYTFSNSGYLNGYRIYTFVGQRYETYLINADVSPVVVVSRLDDFIADKTGWTERGIKNVAFTSGNYQVISVVTNQQSISSQFSAQWDYQNPDTYAAPASGKIVHPLDNLGIIAISKTDNSAADRSASLATVVPGTLLLVSGARWIVQRIRDEGGFLILDILPAGNLPTTGVKTFSFFIYNSEDIDYAVETNGHLGDLIQSGIFYTSGYDINAITPNDNAYGIDVLYQAATVSSDWYLIAGPVTSSAGSAGSELIQSRNLFTGVAGQTTFNVAYQAPNLYVVLNGVILSPSNYTADDNSTVVLNDAIQADSDELEIIVFNPVVVSDSALFRSQIDVYSTAETNALTARPNLLINGALNIWQRGVSFNTANQYTADRFYGFCNPTAGSTATVTLQTLASYSGLVGNPSYFLRYNRTAGASVSTETIQHRLEGIRHLANKWITVEFYAKCSVPRTFNSTPSYITDGSPASGTIDVKALAIGTSWQKFTHTFQMPLFDGTTFGAGANTRLFRLVDPNTDSATYNLDIAMVSAVESEYSVPVDFPDPAQDLAGCQRYFAKQDVFFRCDAVLGGSGTRFFNSFSFPVPMRNVPSMAILSPSYSNANSATIAGATTGTYSISAVANNSGIVETRTVQCAVTAEAEL